MLGFYETACGALSPTRPYLRRRGWGLEWGQRVPEATERMSIPVPPGNSGRGEQPESPGECSAGLS